METVPADKSKPQRQARDLLLQRIHAYWDAQGMTHSDPQALSKALSKALSAVELPGALRHKDRRELGRIYRRARGLLPDGYDDWVCWIEKWDSSYGRRKARDLADRLVRAAGRHRYDTLGKVFDNLKQRVCDHLPLHVRRLERECKKFENDKAYRPELRVLQGDVQAEKLYAALKDAPKQPQHLARQLRVTMRTLWTNARRLRREKKINTFRRQGQVWWARTDDPTAPTSVSVRQAVLNVMRPEPQTIAEIAQAIQHPREDVRWAAAGLAKAKKITKCGRNAYKTIDAATTIRLPLSQQVVAFLTGRPMAFDVILQHVNSGEPAMPKKALSSAISSLKTQGVVKHNKRTKEYRLTPRGRARAKRLAG
jgi:hypothetical protein